MYNMLSSDPDTIHWKQKQKWATSWQNQQNDCAPSEDSDQPGHAPSWSESLQCAQWVAKYPSFLQTDSKDSDQTWADAQADLVCLCWGLTSQSTIFQSCRDGAIASWVVNQYFRGVKCLAQGHNTAEVGFEPPTSRSGVRTCKSFQG